MDKDKEQAIAELQKDISRLKQMKAISSAQRTSEEIDKAISLRRRLIVYVTRLAQMERGRPSQQTQDLIDRLKERAKAESADRAEWIDAFLALCDICNGFKAQADQAEGREDELVDKIGDLYRELGEAHDQLFRFLVERDRLDGLGD